MQPKANDSPPQKWLRWLPWFLFAAVLICATTAFFLRLLSHDTPINRLKQQIRIDVPVGSSRDEVASWAERNGGSIPSILTLPAQGSGIHIYEEARVPLSQHGQVISVTIPSVGSYTTPRGEAASNNLWVFFTLDDAGRVTGRYFLSLEELAAIEQKRLKP